MLQTYNQSERTLYLRYFINCDLPAIYQLFTSYLPIFLKLWIFTNFNMVFPVVASVFDCCEFLEGVQNSYWNGGFTESGKPENLWLAFCAIQ
jgi:hypothetical protein